VWPFAVALLRFAKEGVEMERAAMDDFVRNLVGRLDIDRPTAERVYLFLKQNADMLPGWLELRDGGKRNGKDAPGGRGA
jgi:hypothetical protein